MDTHIEQENRFASFILGGEKEIELAIHAEDVLEAIPVAGAIQPIPTTASYLEGIMNLRNDAIPVINMKKRLGLPETVYSNDAKVAVVSIFRHRMGLLFDDIKDVLMVSNTDIDPIHPLFQTSGSIISDVIKLSKGKRTLELLDLKCLLGDKNSVDQIREMDMHRDCTHAKEQLIYHRFVVFSSQGQDYGVPVNQVQEITFLTEIDDVFKNDAIEGVVRLREHAIPVLNSARLLQPNPEKMEKGEGTRVLVLDAKTFQYGLIVDCVREILSIPQADIMPLPREGNNTVSGIYERANGKNVMLIQVDGLTEGKAEELRSVANLKSVESERTKESVQSHSRHSITADCYLVFSIGRNFAIELNDVQEIIEPKDLMELPAATGFDRRVLNLRGKVVPVINLRGFYGYEANDPSSGVKLIIARKKGRVIAIEVDRILTIYKQVQFKATPSLHPKLADKQDTLDRLIEFTAESGILEHVLVINIETMMDNHLGMMSKKESIKSEKITKENDHDSYSKKKFNKAGESR